MSCQGIEYNISPIDGRYYKTLEKVRNIFSDKELTRTKLNIENEYLHTILNILHPDKINRELRTVLQLDEDKFYKDIKEINSITDKDKNFVNTYQYLEIFPIFEFLNRNPLFLQCLSCFHILDDFHNE